MSRTNPYKKKRRTARRTLLLYGEGLCEEMFLKHLKRLYAHNRNVAVTIRNGRGGNPASIVARAGNAPGGFDVRVVVLDNDKGLKEIRQARSEAGDRSIQLFENKPCLETLLLSVLDGGVDYERRSSGWCKEQFQSQYTSKKKRADIREYQRVFPKDLLDTERTRVKGLDRLIALMEGSFLGRMRVCNRGSLG